MDQSKEQKRALNQEATKDLGRKLKSIRILNNFSQEDIEKRSGLCRSTIVAIEGGYYNTGVRQLTAILDAMGYELVFQPKALSPDHHTA